LNRTVRVWLSIGSNRNRAQNIEGGVRALRQEFGPLALSTVYESDAVGFDGDPFYNLVAGAETALTVSQIVSRLRAIEKAHGRIRDGSKYSPRTLDIDLLTYGDLVIQDGTLELPRPEILQYAFVLAPMADVAGDELHPVADKSYSKLWGAFDKTKQKITPVDLPGTGRS
jgi:2-amino-4-hydroxy-6-hydroxymethyldihydropteridine diphosphokinase